MKLVSAILCQNIYEEISFVVKTSPLVKDGDMRLKKLGLHGKKVSQEEVSQKKFSL